MYVDDVTRARHMRDAAREALGFAAGRERADLDHDRMFSRGLVSCLIEIGEAAAHLTPETRAALAAVPWTQIVAMRNRLVHGYYLIDPDIVWDTVTTHLPVLIVALEQWLTSAPGENQAPG